MSFITPNISTPKKFKCTSCGKVYTKMTEDSMPLLHLFTKSDTPQEGKCDDCKSLTEKLLSLAKFSVIR